MPSRQATGNLWRARHLLLAPHRLAFLLAMALLATSGLWWAGVQGSWLVDVSFVHGALPLSLVHAALMVFGFFPLFFSGFLFTAGPKWLHTPPWPVRTVRAPLLLLASGWLVWLVAAHLSLPVALGGAALALAGMAWVTALFWRLLRRSEAEDQVHARVVGVAFLVGTACIAGLIVCLALGEWALARRFVLSGLWGFAVLVFVTVAHRMLPFFSPPGPHEGQPGARWHTLGRCCRASWSFPWVLCCCGVPGAGRSGKACATDCCACFISGLSGWVWPW